MPPFQGLGRGEGTRFPALKRRAIQIPPCQGEQPPPTPGGDRTLSPSLTPIRQDVHRTWHEDHHLHQGPNRPPRRDPRRDGIKPGEVFEIERIDRGEYRLVRLAPSRNQGLLDWLLACPEKGYFVPIESEATDSTDSPPD